MQEKDLVAAIDQFIDENFDHILEDIGKLIAIPSVVGPAEPDAPYGQPVKQALELSLQIAKRLGLEAHNCDNRIGYAELAGESEEYLATIAHSDVVPAGKGWKTDPFSLVEKDGYLLGRGTIDDKSQLILTFYVGKFLKDLCRQTGQKFKYSFRMLIGCDEEVGMSDVDYYLDKHPQPLFLFTPDADFPAIHGEKGHFSGKLSSKKIAEGDILELESGVAGNVVPGEARIILKDRGQTLSETANISVCKKGQTWEITATGQSAHASTPEMGDSAIRILTDYLLANNLVSGQEKSFFQLVKLLVDDYRGEKLGIAADDAIFSPLTIIGGLLHLKEDRLVQSFDCRYPTSADPEKMEGRIRSLAEEYGVDLTDVQVTLPFLVDPDSRELKVCVDTFNQVFNRQEKAFTIGGGTYAKHFKNAVSYGLMLRDDQYPDFVGTMHGPNEGVPVDRLRLALKTYILATYRLLQLDY